MFENLWGAFKTGGLPGLAAYVGQNQRSATPADDINGLGFGDKLLIAAGATVLIAYVIHKAWK